MLDAEGHGLFLIDMLAGFERRHEMLAMQMLRGGDQYRVDALIVQQVPVIQVRLRRRRNGPCVFQALGVDVRNTHEFGVGAGYRLAHDLRAAIAGADDAETNAVARRQHRGRGDGAGQTTGNFADKNPARLHAITP